MTSDDLLLERLERLAAYDYEPDWADVRARAERPSATAQRSEGSVGRRRLHALPRWRGARSSWSVAAILIVAAIAVAVIATGPLWWSNGPRVAVPASAGSEGAVPPGYHPLTLRFRRRVGVILEVEVTAAAPFRHAILTLQVFHGGVLVYERSVTMISVASPLAGPPGVHAEATWSGVLKPADWRGGCQRGRYIIRSRAMNTEDVPIGGSTVGEQARAFACRT